MNHRGTPYHEHSRRTLSVTKNAREERSRWSLDRSTAPWKCLGSGAAFLVSREISYPSLDTVRQHLFARFVRTGSTVAMIPLASIEMKPWKSNRRNDSCHIHRQADSCLANRNTPLFLSAPLCVVPDTYTLAGMLQTVHNDHVSSCATTFLLFLFPLVYFAATDFLSLAFRCSPDLRPNESFGKRV